MIKKDFQLWFQFLPNPYQEEGELGRSWGRFGFRIEQTELFKRVDAVEPGLEWNLSYLYDWLTMGGWERTPLDVEPDNGWPGALQYRSEAEQQLERAENVAQEDKALERLAWINNKNLWNVGQGVDSPSIFFVAQQKEGYVEASWDQQENLKRGFLTPPSGQIFLDYHIFQSQVNKFLASYQYIVQSILLDPDVQPFFPNEQSVNDALRLLIELSQQTEQQIDLHQQELLRNIVSIQTTQ